MIPIVLDVPEVADVATAEGRARVAKPFLDLLTGLDFDALDLGDVRNRALASALTFVIGLSMTGDTGPLAKVIAPVAPLVLRAQGAPLSKEEKKLVRSAMCAAIELWIRGPEARLPSSTLPC